MVDVVVEYDYCALHDDELTLHPGDVIRNVRKVEEEGWMEGTLNGKTGLFPDNFVKIKKETTEEGKEEPVLRRDRASGNVASLVQRMSTYGFPAGGFQPHSLPRTFVKKRKKRQCKVLFEYIPQNEDELELKVGDIIDIIEEVEEGWWSGTMNGKSGLFPSNFVKEVEVTEDSEANHSTDESDGAAKDSTAAPSTTPTSQGTGNGVSAQPKKVRGVGFGDIFREGSVKLKVRLSNSDAEEKKAEKPLPSLPSAAKPTHLNMTDSVKADGDSKIKVKEYCKVTFPFGATNEDELNLKEGDIICILSKDTGEPGWWKGEINGKEGVFPDNFVTVISDSDKEGVVSKGSFKLSSKQDSEEKPKKPPPPSKTLGLKPEVPSADKKPLQPKLEDKEKPVLDLRLSLKPTAPVVPPKKPAPPPNKAAAAAALLKPGSIPPKRPEKPQPSPLGAKPNGEMPSTRPRSEIETVLPSKLRTLSGDWGEKAVDMDLMSFDELPSTSEKLTHPTTSRPKMPGRRLPAHFGGSSSPNKEASAEKPAKQEDEDFKPKVTDTTKPSPLIASSSPAQKPSPSSSLTSDPKPKGDAEDWASEMEDLRAQMKELQHTVEFLKNQQKRELDDLKNDLDEERQKRLTLQVRRRSFRFRCSVLSDGIVMILV
uniref:CD2-associated protein n=1 Tax=Paramormyrops kingsleyae TaxID=1676925 RepID=A0A3B3SZB6_9TELE